ncbi:uncharacterized protein RHOBADRAFT_50509 [Rhodotorula graminis WP1]|uniref:ubiquitinyl hydrolase 1 n=1 Tax=Rhodotorula graminis (strain WP1) TaxID=578459 RepID=A0A194SC15_RHOGW|nr:uncharacterized protein RHOBADRAFT_50509 [Rhodotorula graminis WP1]KPV77985.1 hypothetical protein RHOBADRAFT_50509 [Rhodotorula graminis WP1]
MDPPAGPPGPSPPPRPPKPSYAAASSSPASKQAAVPPRVPPKPANLQPSPVAPANFFNASPAQAASASTSSPSHGAPAPARPVKPRQPSYPQQPLVPDSAAAAASADDNNDLVSRTSPAGPSTLKKRTSGAQTSPTVTKTYGSGGRRSSAMQRDGSSGSGSRMPWAGKWDQPPPEAAAPAPGPPARPAPPSAWQTPARGPAGGDIGGPATWGGATWQQLATRVDADTDTDPGDVRIVDASPSPPLLPSPASRPQQLLLDGPGAPSGPDLPITFATWWTTPRVLAAPGEMGGGKAGVWGDEVWDFDVAATPAGEVVNGGLRYLAMGEWVSLAVEREEPDASAGASVADEPSSSSNGASEDTAMTVGDNDAAPATTSTADKPLPPVDLASSSSPPPELPPKPRRGFHTPTLADLEHARPHPNLYFCPRTFSWALFAPIRRPPPPISLDSSAAPILWHRVDECTPVMLERYFAERLVGEGGLAHPHPPVPPACPDSFSAQHDPRTEANGRTFAEACTAGRGLIEVHSASGEGRVAIGGTAFYPAVIPRALWERMMRERGDAPAVGKTADEARYEAARVFWRTINNLLFAGEKRPLPTQGKHMAKFMPFDATTNDIFVATLGFGYRDGHILIPHLDEADERGRENRMRLLRCWLEVGIWLEEFIKANSDKGIKPLGTRITIKPSKLAMAAAMGGDDLPRAPMTGAMSGVSFTRTTSAPTDKDALAGDYDQLGVTPNLSDHVVSRVYNQQVQLNPGRVAIMLEALIRIAKSRGSSALEEKVAIERSLDRFPASEVVTAYKELQLANPFHNYVGDDQISAAFDARNSAVEHPERRRVLFEAAHIVANFSQCEILKAMLESMGDEIAQVAAASGHVVHKPRMDLDAAYRALGLDPAVSVDEGNISIVYTIRLEDASSDTEKAKMREALEVIAADKKSNELYTLAQTGKRPDDSSAGWQAGPAADVNLPVGLTNIANTCYLNSLLQYFFTVREVRDAILAFHDTPTPPSQQGQLRVGGRLVSLAEVKRSKRFVALLQNLYQQLIHSSISAVTPETELAYLALVPSREEAEAATAPAATATLTEEPEPLVLADSDKPAEPSASTGVRSPSSSVLGKRKVGEEGAASPPSMSGMQLDSQQSPLSSPPLAGSGAAMAGLSLPTTAGAAEDADMADALAPAEVELRRSKRGKSEEERSGASSVTERQGESPIDGETEEPMSLDLPAAEGGPAQGPPPLPPRRTDAPSPEPQPELPMPPLVNGGPTDDKQKELERQVSSYMAFGRQNDVTECMDNVMFQVEVALLANAPGGQEHATASLLRRTFYGMMRQQLVFNDPSSVPDPVRTQDEPFSSLLVDVSPPPTWGGVPLARDIYDGLDAVFAPSPIELEGHAAERRVALVWPPPPVLQIQLQRVQYDREKQSVYKSNAHLQFYQEIGVARYVEVAEGDEAGRVRALKINELRRVLEKKRERLAQLTKATQSANTATALRSSASHLNRMTRREPDTRYRIHDSISTRVDEMKQLVAETEAEADAIDDEMSALKKRIGDVRREMELLYGDVEGEKDEMRYDLTAVFIHRGTALSGHYYIFQRDHRNPERWLRYNDSVVSEVSKDEVFKETTGDTNAYFLSYVRRDCSGAIESIKREP